MEKNFWEIGLTSAEVSPRLIKFGPNKLAEQRKYSLIRLFFSQFTSPLIYILLLASLVTFFLKDFSDTVIIVLAVVINTLLGFYQEFKAAKGLAVLSAILETRVAVVRDGQRQEILRQDLVPADVVILDMGKKIPADGVLLLAKDFSVNEAILTGESQPVAKEALAAKFIDQLAATKLSNHSQEYPLSQVFMGTDVVTGLGRMLVTATGEQTQMGKIATSLGSREEKTPLQEKLDDFSRILAITVGVISLIILSVGLLTGKPFIEIFPTAVAVAVSAIPEGLVVSLTAILALGMQRILKRKALVRKLVAAETLGGVTVICTDKTGTLTEGKMRVVKTDFTDQRLGILGTLLCNDLRDPLEIAMWEWGKQKISNISAKSRPASGWKNQKLNIENTEKLISDYSRIASKPFSLETKLILTLHQVPQKQEKLMFVSGAPEVVLQQTNLTAKEKEIWLKKFNHYGREGLRLVGFAYRWISESKKQLGTSDAKPSQWLGVVIYEDPIREGVSQALKTVQKAGIKIKVITGDHLETAKAVLKKLELVNGDLEPEEIMLGEELEKLSPTALRSQLARVILFARTNPQQKLKIVQVLQEQGEIVAMTGDGINDAPALKKADIGIVVSQASDVSKETADMVLLDDNFVTIVAAIEEGRGIFENIRKVMLYLLSDSLAEVILIFASLLLGLPLPILASQILWVNLVDDGLPSLALTMEPKDKDLMSSPPRHPKTNLMDMEMKVLIGVISTLMGMVTLGFFGFMYQANPEEIAHTRTLVFTILSVTTLFYVFSCRHLKKPHWRTQLGGNPWLILAVLSGFSLQLLAIYVPFFQRFLQTVPLGWQDWSGILATALIVILMIEGVKWAFLHIRH